MLNTNNLQALDRVAILNILSRNLASHCNETTSNHINPSFAASTTLRDGLTVLYNCHDEWESASRPFAAMPGRVLGGLRSLPLSSQRAFDDLLRCLFGADWAAIDDKYQVTGDFEISAVLWALQIGPRGLANGWAAGCSTLSTVMAAEEAWVLDNVGGDNYKDKVALLEGFADGLCRWGCEISEEIE